MLSPRGIDGESVTRRNWHGFNASTSVAELLLLRQTEGNGGSRCPVKQREVLRLPIVPLTDSASSFNFQFSRERF